MARTDLMRDDMRHAIEPVAKLMQAGDQQPGVGTASLYRTLIDEEYSELIEAEVAQIEHEEFDACLDLIWVTIGYMLSRGWPVPEGWSEVAESNLAKIGPDGRLEKRADGKVLKPAGWTPPDLKGVLARSRGEV